jgi:spore germination protein KA
LFVICAMIAGLYGLSLGFLLLIHHLNTLEIFGVPYLSPFVANEGRDITKDTIFRVPLHLMKKRPSSLKTSNKKRQS